MWIKTVNLSLVVLACVVPATAPARQPKLTPAEQPMLPKYCWATHVDRKFASTPGHTIPRSCGKAMNHLCPAHVSLIAAQRATEPVQMRHDQLTKAIANFKYTLRGMEPDCPLRAEVEISLSMATLLRKSLR